MLSLPRPPGQVTCWPGSPHLAVVVAVTARAENGQSDYDEVTVACTRNQLRESVDS
jgi:hypothetical protein